MRMRTLPAALAVGVLGFGLAIAAPTAATAHDQLLGGTPFEGDIVDAGPEDVTMTFSADLLDIASGSIVLVVDDDEHDWVAGPPVLDGRDISVPLEPEMPDGVYEVRWQVVSSDGHPISDVFKFGVGDVDPALLERSPLPSGGDAVAAEPEASAEAGDSGAVLTTIVIGAAGAMLGIGVFLLVLLMRRRRISQHDITDTDRNHTA